MSMTNEAYVVDEEAEKTRAHRRMANSNHSVDSVAVEDKTGKQRYLNHDANLIQSNIVAAGLERFWESFDHFVAHHQRAIKKVVLALVIVLVIVYIGAVIHQFHQSDHNYIDWCQGYGMAFIVLCLTMWILIYYTVITPHVTPRLVRLSHNKAIVDGWRKARVAIAVILVIMLAAFLIWDTSSDRRRLISVGGLLTFIFCGFLFSKYPTRIRWSTVFCGLAIQICMGLFAIRWRFGRQAFKCVGMLAEKFLVYAYVGAELVYGKRLIRDDAVFAFQALSVIFFASMIIQVLFYLGWMQRFCLKLGWLIQTAMGTTVMESVNAISSVFLGMTEAPLLYKPYIKDLTLSEVHAVMVGGFSTIAGTVFAAYASFGVDPSNIITAAFMSAPTALCFSKLLYPETTQSKTDSNNIQIYKSDDKSVLDAVIQGANIGTSMVLGIIATVIACVSFIAFFNDFLAWLGMLAGVQNFTLEVILSYLLFPAVWLMGVETSQCRTIARLIGIKVTVNEFAAYMELGELAKAGVLSPRTEAIATFALCSFANPGSVGILIATLTTLEPSQRHNIISVSLRAFFTAVVVTWLTACVAGALMPEEGFSD